jgi:broad specificity phosphatase PhoE
MQTIWIARHAHRQDVADPDWAATADRPHDPGLAPSGDVQARKLGDRVASLDVDRIVCSPFLRAVQTAHHVAEAADQTVLLEPGLGEWQNPDWFDAAPAPLSPSTLADRFERVVGAPPPCREPQYPESKHECLARIGDTAQCLTDRFGHEDLLLVGHGITVQGVLQGLLDGHVPDPGCPLASLTTVVRRADGWHLRRRNDTRHLENGARSTTRPS